MQKFNETLTVGLLSNLYGQWAAANGHGRDNRDQRFGQHIVNTYGINGPNPDAFYVEDAGKAFSLILAQIDPDSAA